MIWFDLDNSPHVPLFRYVFKELDSREIPYFITARDFAQTKDLLELWNIPHKLIGVHGGRNKIKKILNIYNRSNELISEVKNKNIKLAVSHGSRSQAIAARRLGIPSILMLDYEYTESRIFNLISDRILMPSLIPDSRLKEAGFNLRKIIRYNGLKEELYLDEFSPDPDFRKTINIAGEKILVTVRPPSLTGNYHDNRSEEILIEGLRYFSSNDNVRVLILSRNESDKKFIEKNIPEQPNIEFLNKPVDGLQLLYASDIALSGGGTMNRESALLGTATYSIFTGRPPYIDEYLEKSGKLNFISSSEDIRKIKIEKKRKAGFTISRKDLKKAIIDIFINKIETKK